MNAFHRISSLVFLMILLCGKVLSQNDSVKAEIYADSSISVPAIPIHALYTGLGYGSSMIYQGSSIPQNQTSGYAALMYGFRNKLFASVSAFKIANSTQLPDFYNYSLIYMNSFTKWLDLSAALAAVQFNGMPDTLLHDFIYSDITAGLSWKFLKANISCSGLFSDKSRYYYQLKTSAYFQTPYFLKGKAYLSVNPYVNLLLGSYLQENSSYVTTTYTTYDTITISDRNPSPVINETSNGQSSQSSSSVSNSLITITPVTTHSGTEITSYSKAFGLMEINAGLPVAINFNKAAFEVEAGYLIPLHPGTYIPNPKGFVFRMSLFLRIL